MANLNELITANAIRWNNAKLTRNFVATAKGLVSDAAKTRYVAVSEKTNVPWFVIAVIHERESSQRWDTQLSQGDPLHKKSVHIPTERGPFDTWEEGAYDALVNCHPHASRWANWTPGGALTLLEQYNGLGYFYHDMPSPYIWSGTDQYKSGKYVRDGVLDTHVVDIQPGCAGLLKAMMQLDSTISFIAKTA